MSDLDNMYQQIILDGARERYGEGTLEDYDGESFQVNSTCGDEIDLRVKLSDDGTTLKDIKWHGQGCSISQASISIMTQMVEGKSIAEVKDLYESFRTMMDGRGHEVDEETEEKLEDAAAFAGVSKFPMRIKCALLGWMALIGAADSAVSGAPSDKSGSAALADSTNLLVNRPSPGAKE
ncbi:MAG: SUF system NifU family Fe-S cluster assembly protein [Actinomycetaceae bacterium]|nr:SUF system NifU family Fe-S cluster assembly protein [Actinomycetaceae bacterium]MDY6083233.1 SUF system NifU family Fe-S cluster assembly protein [Actinomycetaceae bacterium]